jgi:hypothetical protein
MRLNVSFDAREVERALTDLERQALPAAMTRALNKTATAVRANVTRQIRKERPGLKAGTIREQLKIERAKRRLPEASVVASGRPIPLRDYGARKTKAGVTVQVGPGGRKRVAHNGNRAFVVDRIGGHVFAREGRKRLPIKKLYGPSIPSTFLKEPIVQAMREEAGRTMPKRLREELNFELRRLGMKA